MTIETVTETTTATTTVATTTVATTTRTLSEEEKLEAELAAIDAESTQLKLLHTEQQRRQDELRRQSQSESDVDTDERVLSIDVPMLAMREVRAFHSNKLVNLSPAPQTSRCRRTQNAELPKLQELRKKVSKTPKK